MYVEPKSKDENERITQCYNLFSWFSQEKMRCLIIQKSMLLMCILNEALSHGDMEGSPPPTPIQKAPNDWEFRKTQKIF